MGYTGIPAQISSGTMETRWSKMLWRQSGNILERTGGKKNENLVDFQPMAIVNLDMPAAAEMRHSSIIPSVASPTIHVTYVHRDEQKPHYSPADGVNDHKLHILSCLSPRIV